MPFRRKFALLCAVSVLFSVSFQHSTAQQKSAVIGQGASVEANFRSWLTSFEKSGAKVAQVASRYDAASDTLAVQGLSIRWPQQAGANRDAGTLEFRVGDLAVRSLKTDGQGFTFQSILMNDAALLTSETSPAAFKIAKFTAENGKLPSLAAFVADPAKPFTTQIRLMRLLARATVENASAEMIEVGNLFAAASASLEGLSGAKAGLVQFTALESRSAPNEAGESSDSAKVDLLKVSNVDFDPYLRLFETSAYLDRGSARPWVNMIDAVELNGLKIKNGSVVADVNSVRAGPLKLKQFSENLTETFDRAAVDPGFLVADPDSARKLATSVRGAFALDSLSGEGIVVAGQNQSGIVNATVAKAEVAHFTADSISRISANTLNLTDATGQVTLSSLDVGGIKLVPIKRDTEKTSRSGSNEAGKETIVPTIASIGAQGLSLKLQGMSASVDQFDLAMAYFIGATPTNVKAQLEHLKFQVNDIAVPQVRQTLEDLDYSDIDLSFNFSGQWDHSSSGVFVDDLRVVGVGMGSLSISGTLAGVSRAGLESPTSVLPTELANAGLRNLRIVFENGTLFDRFIRKVGEANGRSVDEIKKMLSSGLPNILSGITPAELRSRFVFSAIAFLNNPHTLIIAATPSENVTLKDLAANMGEPSKLPALLNAEISTNNRR